MFLNLNVTLNIFDMRVQIRCGRRGAQRSLERSVPGSDHNLGMTWVDLQRLRRVPPEPPPQARRGPQPPLGVAAHVEFDSNV